MMPFGLTQQKPRHYRDMLRIVWSNRRALPFAWRILRDGVCDGCALGTSGLRDWTLDGTHLCMVRLELLELNTASALDHALFSTPETLSLMDGRALRQLGRLSTPLLRRAGSAHFRTVSWADALTLAGSHIRDTSPERMAFYLTSRGLTNEAYFAAQKTARWLGTNHVDNAARLCHAASTVALKGSLGHGAATLSYRDWLDADLIVLFGSNVANNQPVTMKYLHHAKARGAAVAVVNPLREPGLERYWVPSIASSAVRGTTIADDWFDVHTGGDLAFLVGVLKALTDMPGGIDRAFVDAHTTGFRAVADYARATPWEDVERESGLTRDRMEAFASLLVHRPRAIFVWSMGLTQHAHGVDTVRALVNVALARGLPLRPSSGLVPIRGHSGVQGGAEVGCTPTVPSDLAAHWSALWKRPLPTTPGWTATEMVEKSADGRLDVFWMVGGNLLDTWPDRGEAERALARPRLRVHHDIVLTTAMLAPSEGDVLLLPATTRYESPGGGTETTTERRIIYSPEVPGPRVGDARPEWRVFRELVAAVSADLGSTIGLESAGAIREEIDAAIPLYSGIAGLKEKGDALQWGGPRLYHNGRFATPSGDAAFCQVALRSRALAAGEFYVSTRRGKQFNSMIQRDIDPLTGAGRDDVLMSAEDAAAHGLAAGDRVRLRSRGGLYEGRVRISPVRSGNLEVHWPEGNVLLAGAPHDPESLEPDYNTVVTLERAAP